MDVLIGTHKGEGSIEKLASTQVGETSSGIRVVYHIGLQVGVGFEVGGDGYERKSIGAVKDSSCIEVGGKNNLCRFSFTY